MKKIMTHTLKLKEEIESMELMLKDIDTWRTIYRNYTHLMMLQSKEEEKYIEYIQQGKPPSAVDQLYTSRKSHSSMWSEDERSRQRGMVEEQFSDNLVEYVLALEDKKTELLSDLSMPEFDEFYLYIDFQEYLFYLDIRNYLPEMKESISELEREIDSFKHKTFTIRQIDRSWVFPDNRERKVDYDALKDYFEDSLRIYDESKIKELLSTPEYSSKHMEKISFEYNDVKIARLYFSVLERAREMVKEHFNIFNNPYNKMDPNIDCLVTFPILYTIDSSLAERLAELAGQPKDTILKKWGYAGFGTGGLFRDWHPFYNYKSIEPNVLLRKIESGFKNMP